MYNHIINEGEEAADNEINASRKQRKGWSRFCITVEPIKFVIGFVINFTNGVTIDLLQRNICYQTYNLTVEQCVSNMTDDMKSTVEGRTADMNMLNQICMGFIPILLVLFVGPWSDKNGRKPFTILPLLGYSINNLAWAVLAFFPEIPVYYLFIPSAIVGLAGGFNALYVCTWSYTCDNFEPEERPYRFSLNVSSTVTGGLLGNALAGQVVHLGGKYGYQAVFFTSSAMSLLAVLYTIFCLEETIVRLPGVPRTKLIDFENVKSTFTVLLIRPEKGILLSLLILLVLLCEIPLNAGDDGILYLVGKSHYRWSLNTFNLVTALSSIASVISPIFFIWLLMDVLKMTNTSVLIISLTIFVVSEVLKALSVNQIMFWSAIFSTKLGGFIGPAIDTELSYIVSENDIGKAFTMTSLGDALSPVMSIPLYTAVYHMFLPDHTPYVFFLSAILATIALFSTLGIFFTKLSFSYSRQINVLEGP